MKTTIRLFLTVCLLLTSIPSTAQQPSIIPQPNQMVMGNGTFVVKKNATIGCENAQLRPAAQYLSELLGQATGYRFMVVNGKGTIQLTLATTGKAGTYKLTVDKRGVCIEGNTYRGVINGIATLRQLFDQKIESTAPVKGYKWTLPMVSIQDEPRFEWRGMELDCSRHFFSPDEVKRLLDVLALYKIDKMHWHLTDDQGWRVEIKRYPLLTTNGAWRIYNNQDTVCIQKAAAQDAPNMEIQKSKTRTDSQGNLVYGGFYTQDDIRSIVDYAKVRGIEIIPEIDMPGHSLMAINNYDGLSCFKQTGWGRLFTTPMCPGKDTMLEFCTNVWSEIFDLFPSKYVHIGGDEVDRTNWTKCPDCQKRMKDNGLTTEAQLQTWFNHYMEDFFTRHGKQMIGWDEIIEGGLTPTSAVMWWRSWAPKSPKQTTAHGNQLICTPNTQFYIDYEEDRNSIPAILGFEPMQGLTSAEQQLVLGVQANLWTEWVPSVDRMWYQAFPRMLAVAELGWAKKGDIDVDDFNRRMVSHLPRLQTLGVSYRIPDLRGFYNTNVFTGTEQVSVTCPDPTATVRYTTDGSIPQATSTPYEGTLTVDKTTHFIFRTFGSDGRKGDMVKCSYIKENYAPSVVAANTEKGLLATWHDYTGADCAGIEKAEKKGTYVVDDVKIPNEVSGNIGLIITGYIDVPADGVYTFALLSDDGSYLKIDGQMVVDNDGEHSSREIIGQHAMCKGKHPIFVRYFDHNGGTLRLRVMDKKGNDVSVAYSH